MAFSLYWDGDWDMKAYYYQGMNMKKGKSLGGSSPRKIEGTITRGCIGGFYEREATFYGIINRVFFTPTSDPMFHI